MGAASAQQVQIDRYRGSVGVPGVPAPTPFVLPNYVNLGAAPPQETGLSNLLAFAADSSNLDLANHTTRANFPILETDALPLSCADIALTPDACARQLKGLVAYTLVKFPADGVYQFAAGFDDRLQLAVANANSVPANFRDAAMYTDTFSYKICLASPAFDGSQVCDIATVTVTVAAPSTPPAIAPVPVGHPLLLAVLAALMAGMCALRLRR